MIFFICQFTSPIKIDYYLKNITPKDIKFINTLNNNQIVLMIIIQKPYTYNKRKKGERVYK